MMVVNSAVSYPSKLTPPFGCGISTESLKRTKGSVKRGREKGRETASGGGGYRR